MHWDNMSSTERFFVKIGSFLLPKSTAFRIVRGAFATQGIGYAAPASGMSGSGEAKFLINFLAKKIRPVVFDVGANIGEYSLNTLLANTATVLHCFEPSAPHYLRLKSALKNTNAFLMNFGLSDKNEEMILNKDTEITGLASLLKRDLSHLNIRLDKSEIVKLKNGDNYVTQNKIEQIDLLKIDVEGWEMSVINGLKESFQLKKIKCCQFEFGHAHIERREIFRDFWIFFKNMGYRMGSIKPNGEVNQINSYDEIYENYYATNYVAFLK